MRKYILMGLALAALSLSACGGGTPAIPVAAASASEPVQYVQQQQQPDHSLLWGAGGMAAGYLLGRNSGSHSGGVAPPVVHRTTVVNQTVVQKKIVNVTQPRREQPRFNQPRVNQSRGRR